MTGAEMLRLIMSDQNVTQTALAKKLGCSLASLNNKLTRDSWTVIDFVNAVNALDCDVIIQSRNTRSYRF